jgi:uncharacterized protein (TIGR02646 family)
MYCSYCERPLPTSLAVEHVEPKFWHPALRLAWDNFLLACTNCNSTKGDENIQLHELLLPDRDNTSTAFEYDDTGQVQAAAHLRPALRKLAEKTLTLTGQNKQIRIPSDPALKGLAISRRNQRRNAWLEAVDAHNDLAQHPSDGVRRRIVAEARARGFFSIWMKVFEADPDMRLRFIAAFEGTAADCFDSGGLPVSPRPANGLAHGGRV